jgi:putative ubiquitin-RnfH superfamily antitoxin RatB of RatAB toxin-antitoxin module
VSSGTAPFVVEVRCALRERQEVSQVRVAPGETVADAVRRCGILARFPELDPDCMSFAIHGARAAARQRLRPGDRVDLLRPLAADPRETRRRRARKTALGKARGSAARNGAAARPPDDTR